MTDVVHSHSRHEWQLGMDHTVAIKDHILSFSVLSFVLTKGERVRCAILWSQLKMNILNCAIIGFAKFFCSHEILGHICDLLKEVFNILY